MNGATISFFKFQSVAGDISKKPENWLFLGGFLPISQAMDHNLKIAVAAPFLFI